MIIFYILKLNQMLHNTSKFERLNMRKAVLNHIIHMVKRNIDLLKNSKNQNEISKKIYNLHLSGSKLGILYKLDKTLEDGIQTFHPILSATGAPTYKLAKFRNHTNNQSRIYYKRFVLTC